MQSVVVHIKNTVMSRLLAAISLLFVASYTGAQDYSYEGTADYRTVKADVEFLASDALEGRAAGQHSEKVAAEYIAARMYMMGLEPGGVDDSYFQPFSVQPNNPHQVDFSDSSDATINAINVMGYLDNDADYTMVVGAHYDHLGMGEFFGSLYTGGPAIHNGADDNASGVAAMLQIAEYCIENIDDINVLIIGFSGEERGLWGSNYFVKNPTIDLESVSYMINLDMVGRLKDERKLSVNGVGTAPQWMEAMEKIDVDGMSIVTTESGIGASDHTSFYFAEIPAIHFFTGQHADYHKPSDDPEFVNYDGIISVVHYINALIEELGDDKLDFTETKNDNQPSARDFKVTLGVMPDYLYTEGGMRIDGVRSDRPAEKAGIEKGDVVIRIGEVEITSMEDYMNALGKFSPGQEVDVIVVRDGTEITKKVKFD